MRRRHSGKDPNGFWFWFSRRRKIPLIFLLWMCWISCANAVTDCPKPCSCLGSMVDCSNKKLSEIPRDIPVWTEHLDLNDNNITFISKESLTHLVNLKSIDVSKNLMNTTKDLMEALSSSSVQKIVVKDNKIRELRVPRSLPRLKELNVRSNDIYLIKGLERAANLESLDLSDNQLTNLASSAVNASIFPKSLTKLKLNNNRVARITKETFAPLEALTVLEISRNRITDLDGLAFNGLSRLTRLTLDNNNITTPNDGAFWGLSALERLSLQHNAIQGIKKGWVYGMDRLKWLNVSHNSIEFVENGCWVYAKNVSTIDLSLNQLKNISKATFIHTENLVELILRSNKINHATDDSLRTLRRLQVLDLSDNHIGHVLELPSTIFANLQRLRVLLLRNVRLTALREKTFKGLKQLDTLDLGDNPISIVEPGFAATVTLPERFFVQTRSFLCDCDAKDFLLMLRRRSYAGASFLCELPAEYRGRELASLDADRLKCLPKSRPVIQFSPQNTVATVGLDVTLRCVAAFTSNSSSSQITWTKDDAPIIDAKLDVTQWTSGELVIVESNLTLSGVQRSSAGSYRCIASNTFGPTFSNKTKLTVHELPTFTKLPTDVKTRVMGRARLECAAVGVPVPQVKWRKDGNTGTFPAAKEKRILYPENNVMYFLNVTKEDAGVYSCVATNSAGSVVTNITFSVTDALADLVLEDTVTQKLEGEVVIFECRRPLWRHIQWRKNSVLLLPSSRHLHAGDGHQLIVSQLIESDAGIYQCENIETNELGDSSVLKITRKKGMLGIGLDPVTEWWLTIALSVTTAVIVTAVVCVICWACCCRKKVSPGGFSIKTDTTMLPEETLNPLDRFHPELVTESPVQDFIDSPYAVGSSIDDEYALRYHQGYIVPNPEMQPCLYRRDESASESQSFMTYATVKPRFHRTPQVASSNRAFSTMPRLHK